MPAKKATVAQAAQTELIPESTANAAVEGADAKPTLEEREAVIAAKEQEFKAKEDAEEKERREIASGTQMIKCKCKRRLFNADCKEILPGEIVMLPRAMALKLQANNAITVDI